MTIRNKRMTFLSTLVKSIRKTNQTPPYSEGYNYKAHTASNNHHAYVVPWQINNTGKQ